MRETTKYLDSSIHTFHLERNQHYRNNIQIQTEKGHLNDAKSSKVLIFPPGYFHSLLNVLFLIRGSSYRPVQYLHYAKVLPVSKELTLKIKISYYNVKYIQNVRL